MAPYIAAKTSCSVFSVPALVEREMFIAHNISSIALKLKLSFLSEECFLGQSY